MKKIILICLSILLFGVVGLCQSSVELLDKYVESARSQWQVPGLSIAVVQDGKVVFSKGYGVRELGKNEPVTTETLFGRDCAFGRRQSRKSVGHYIASCTRTRCHTSQPIGLAPREPGCS